MDTWSELPNAAHIDTIFADAQARPEVWERVMVDAIAWSKDRTGAWAEAYWVSRDTVRDLAWGPSWDTVRDRLGRMAELVVGDAVCALIAWPESAALLDLTPDALHTIIDVADGGVKHQAILLLPAVIARSTP